MMLTKYLELTKPRVTSLNIAVGIACFLLAGIPAIDWQSLIIFTITAYLTVGGCGALNCYFDRDLDKLMDRTCRRAVPSGSISPANALLYGLVLLAVGLSTAYFAFSRLTFSLIVVGVIVYLLVYTLWLKRRSQWNVVVGGISGSFAALSGWAATGNGLSLMPMIVALLDFFWTPGHLWGLAIGRVEDYARAEIPMLPVTNGVGSASRYVLMFNALTVVSSLLFFLLGLVGPVFLAITVSVGVLLLWRSWRLLESPSEDRGLKLFLFSVTYLSCLMGILVVDRLLL